MNYNFLLFLSTVFLWLSLALRYFSYVYVCALFFIALIFVAGFDIDICTVIFIRSQSADSVNKLEPEENGNQFLP